MNEGMIVLVAMISGLIGAILVRGWMNTPMERVSQQPSVTIVDEQPLPYWTEYGLPNYWPTYLSPYWMVGVPWYGPIGGGGSYYYPDRQRRPYNPSWHGGRQGHGPGYSGVAVGGGGGGGGGGHH
jgi:hypothetical protein